MPRSVGRDLAEIFGHAPDDLAPLVRKLWETQRCPFTQEQCSKYNHDKSICYGACSVVANNSRQQPIIICPKRLYADNYQVLRHVSEDAYPGLPFFLYDDYCYRKRQGGLPESCVVALGQGSGKEVQIGGKGNKLSIDWILTVVEKEVISAFTGIEVQSIDITGNYRDNWAAYEQLISNPSIEIPEAGYGLNWANVHKRLIPQIIRKGRALTASRQCIRGLYFVLPDIVFRKFEAILGSIKRVASAGPGILSVFTYALGPAVPRATIRELVRVRIERVRLDDFALSFIAGDGIANGHEIESRLQTIFKS